MYIIGTMVLTVLPIVIGVGIFAAQWLDEEFFKYPIINDED